MSETAVSGQPALINSLLYLRDLSEYSLQRCEDLLARDLPFKESEVLTKTFSSLFEKIRAKLQLVIKNINRYEGPEIVKLISIHGKTLSKLHELFMSLEPLGRENISQSNVYLLEHATEKLDSKGTRFIFVPSYDFDFMLIDILEIFHSLTNDDSVFEEAKKENISKIYLIEFPFVYKDNIVINSMVAHEVGHYLCYSDHFTENYNKVYNLFAQQIREDVVSFTRKLMESTVMKVSEMKDGSFEKFMYDQATTQLTAFVAGRLSMHVKEILSDLMAYESFGPVYLISCFHLLLATSSDYTPLGSHPPLSVRMNYLITRYELSFKTSKNAELTRIVDSVRSILETLKGDELKNLGELTYIFEKNSILLPLLSNQERYREELASILTKFTELITNGMVQKMERDVTLGKFDSISASKKIPQLMALLQSNVPPAELEAGIPADIPSVLNAGIIYKSEFVNKVAEEKKEWDSSVFEKSLTIDRLILKAVELSAIHMRLGSDNNGGWK